MDSDWYLFQEALSKVKSEDFPRTDWFQSRARYYFPFCPLCGNGKEVTINVSFDEKDTITCEKCGAKWHIYFSILTKKLKWGKLESPSKDGRGRDYLGKEIKPVKWKEMAIKSHEVFERNKKKFG